MIIALESSQNQDTLDLLLQAFDGSLPVANEHEQIIGQCWLMERGPTLIVLTEDRVAEAVEWSNRGKTALICGYPDELADAFAEDNVLVVSDRPGAYPCCTLVGSDPQELADLIERAIQ